MISDGACVADCGEGRFSGRDRVCKECEGMCRKGEYLP